MSSIPNTLQDAKDLLSNNGFVVGKTWYHGTSSGLTTSIQTHGLKRSGDKALKQSAKQIMATIGNSYTETIEPVFLTQSKELAYYWAEQTIKERGVHTEKEEPVVIAINLSEEINDKVKPDVGAASLMLVQGNDYLDYLSAIYKKCGFDAPVIDPAKADRMDYLNKLGMAYIDQNIDPEFIECVKADR